MYNILVLLVFVSVTNARDITVGSDAGKKIFDENFQASPAIWRQVQNVTINTTDDEVISKIIVKDLRAEKDGDVNIVDGGEGQEKVTLELKSPTALRGYDFRIEAYAVPKSQEKVKDEDKLQDDLTHPRQVGIAKNPPETSQSTELNFADPRINHDDRTTIIPESNEKRLPLIISADTNDNNNERKIRDTTHDTNKQDGDSLKSKHPSLAGVEIKKTEIPVNKYGENKSEGSNNPKPGDAETNNGDMLPMDKDLKENNGETRHTRAFDDETNKKVTSKIDKTNENRRIGNDEGTPKFTKESNFSPLNKNSASLSFPPPTPTGNDRNARETNKNTKSEVSVTPLSNNYPTHFSSQTDSKNVPSTFNQDTPSIDSLKTNAPDVKSITNNPDIKDKDEKLAPTIITGKNVKPESTITNDKERIVRDTHNEDKIENYNLPKSLGSSNITNDQNNEKSGYSPTSLKESIIPAVSLNGQNKNNPVSDKPAVEHKDEKQIPAVTSRGSNKPDSTMTNDKERTARDTNNADKNENHNIHKALNSNDNNERSGNLPKMLKNINIPTLLLNEDNKSNPVSTSPPNNPLVENKGTSPQPVTSQNTNPSEANDYLHTLNPVHQEHPVPYPYDASSTTPKVDHKRDTSSDKVDTVKDSSRKSPRLASTTENIELSTVKVNIPRISGQAVPYSYTTPKSEHKRDTVSTEKSAEKNEDARSEENLKIPPKIFGNGNAKPVISIQ
ncbi:homeobox protein 2-like [Galleria mellonella]|uniref:Homeobox protein 2-like n=1 Tax=Galleria mellonella TaxID=7137 RepID=A0A6J1WTZ5_GALME|nr:homeobox protein 2-like [Galleria mellonella]